MFASGIGYLYAFTFKNYREHCSRHVFQIQEEKILKTAFQVYRLLFKQAVQNSYAQKPFWFSQMVLIGLRYYHTLPTKE